MANAFLKVYIYKYKHICHSCSNAKEMASAKIVSLAIKIREVGGGLPVYFDKSAAE